MKVIRKIVKNPIFCIFMIGLTLLSTGCTKEQIFNSSTSSQNYSGEDLFKGIFFAKGAVAEKLPTIKNSRSYFQINELQEKTNNADDSKMDELMDEIEVRHPNFYGNLQSSIDTKNHLIIEEALKNAADVIYETATELYLSQEVKDEFNNIVADFDINDCLKEDGSLDYKMLNSHLQGSLENEEVDPQALGIILVAAAYILVVHAVGVMTYVGVAWAVEYYAAVDREKAVSRGNLTDDDLVIERLIEDLVNL